jgi:hypothetical protein
MARSRREANRDGLRTTSLFLEEQIMSALTASICLGLTLTALGELPPLGSLSEKYESGGRGPGTVSTGKGDAGGVSYGTYQLSSKVGRADQFVQKYYAEEFKGLKGGTAEFTARWRRLAQEQPDQLRAREHEFIKNTHYDPLVKTSAKGLMLNVEQRSRVLQNVIWSTAVQHGPGTRVVDTALRPLLKDKTISDLTDAQIIRAIYAERGRKGDKGLIHFQGNSEAVQRAVAKRFDSELRDALAALEKESK